MHQSLLENKSLSLLPQACMLLTCKQFMRALFIFHGVEMDVSCQVGANVETEKTKSRGLWRKLKYETGRPERAGRICAARFISGLASISPHKFIRLPFSSVVSDSDAIQKRQDDKRITETTRQNKGQEMKERVKA